ncbi:hypothetical protein ATB98_14355 [Sinorhizobium saheli]|uniref:Uncharacterized protein n=1 Tax=Sinorhizobium saheli TaxID=36856 RepID=A0A178YGL7_SINSA|nr:hypothetical protein ATB98_14355 [Sinorhizobium saheli]
MTNRRARTNQLASIAVILRALHALHALQHGSFEHVRSRALRQFMVCGTRSTAGLTLIGALIV